MSIASLQGSLLVSADNNSEEFLPSLAIDERVFLGAGKHAVIPVDLTSDAPVVVDMHGLSAHIVVARATSGKAKMTVTSTDGAAQNVPIDPLGIVISRSVPITAISFTRVAGVANSVKLFIGQKV